MGKKIKPANFMKQCAKGKQQTYKDWVEETKGFKRSVNPSMGLLTPVDLLYDSKKSENTILDTEFVKADSIEDARMQAWAEKNRYKK